MSCEKTALPVLDLTPFAGEWVNTNEGLREIERVSLRTLEGQMYLRVRGSAHPAGVDWGEIKIESVYCDSANSSQATSFVARYDFELLRVEIGVNLNQGLLVVAMFNSWNESQGTDYFAREFFRQ